MYSYRDVIEYYTIQYIDELCFNIGSTWTWQSLPMHTTATGRRPNKKSKHLKCDGMRWHDTTSLWHLCTMPHQLNSCCSPIFSPHLDSLHSGQDSNCFHKLQPKALPMGSFLTIMPGVGAGMLTTTPHQNKKVQENKLDTGVVFSLLFYF